MSEQAKAGWSGAGARPRFSSIAEPAAGEFDALADLFLGPGEFGVPRSEGAARVPIEAVVLGHLPVLAPAWVKQYAAHRARQLGRPVGLVRISAGQVAVEVVGDGAEQAKGANLGEAIASAAGRVAAWLIKTDEPGEPVIARHGAVSAITLLSGTDEAALVACYRAFKGLAPQDAEGPGLRIAWMGSNAEKAAEAMAKLGRATQAFLSKPVEDGGCLARIDSSQSSLLYSGEGPELEAILTMLDEARPAEPVRAEAGESSVLRLATGSEEEEAEEAIAPEMDAGSIAAAPSERGLSAHVAGLSPLSAACPDAPGVELAADGSGRLNLLCRVSGAPGEAASRLAVASAWAVKNRELLALAFPALKAHAAGVAPVKRLFTHQPKTARALLDGDVQVHVLLAVEVEGKTAWACAELN